MRVPELRPWTLPREIPIESANRSCHQVSSSHGERDHRACHTGSPSSRHFPPSAASLNHAVSTLQECFSDDVNTRLALRRRNGAADSLQQRLAFIRALRKIAQAGLAKERRRWEIFARRPLRWPNHALLQNSHRLSPSRAMNEDVCVRATGRAHFVRNPCISGDEVSLTANALQIDHHWQRRLVIADEVPQDRTAVLCSSFAGMTGNRDESACFKSVTSQVA